MTRTLKILLVGLTASALSTSGVAFAAAHGSASEHTNRYQWLIGSGGTSPPLGPDITRDTTNGHILEVVGQGTFVKGDTDSVTGGGTFVVTDDAAHVLAQGTWTATELDHFTSFGNGSGFPEDFEGGLARLDIRIHPAGTSRTFAGSLQIHCAINNPSSIEGVQAFAAGDAFTVPVFGETVFINQDSDPAPG
jgi:hypothetical protein